MNGENQNESGEKEACAGRKEPRNDILQTLRRRRVSMKKAAKRLGVSRGHLRRVLQGERGSRKVVGATEAMMDEMPKRPRRMEEMKDLLDAAVHAFFARRGRFQSEIFTGYRQRMAGRARSVVN